MTNPLDRIGSYFRLMPPIGDGASDDPWRGVILCLACNKSWALTKPMRVSVIVASLKLHKILECVSNSHPN